MAAYKQHLESNVTYYGTLTRKAYIYMHISFGTIHWWIKTLFLSLIVNKIRNKSETNQKQIELVCKLALYF